MMESIHARCLKTRSVDGRTDICRKSKGHDGLRMSSRTHYDPDHHAVWHTDEIDFYSVGDKVTQTCWDGPNGALQCNSGRTGKIVKKYAKRVDVEFPGDSRIYRIHPECLRKVEPIVFRPRAE